MDMNSVEFMKGRDWEQGWRKDSMIKEVHF